MTVVGNLIGEQTVDVVPRAPAAARQRERPARRPREARPGARQDRGLRDRRAGQAGRGVARGGAKATIRQREADLKLASSTSSGRKNLFGRQLLAKQTLDDAEARFWRPQAQLDLVAGADRSRRRPARRAADQPRQHQHHVPGRWLRRQAERRSRRVGVAERRHRLGGRYLAPAAGRQRRREGSPLVNPGDQAMVEVDAFPGEMFNGHIARVSPVLDPATRTAPMEVEIPNTEIPPQAGHVRPGAPRDRGTQGRDAGAEGRGRGLRRQARRVGTRAARTRRSSSR